MNRSGEPRRSGMPPGIRALRTCWATVGLLVAVCSAAGSDISPAPEPDVPREAAFVTPSCAPWLPGDELWVISTRHLGCPRHCSDFQPMVRQFLGHRWHESSLEQLAESPPRNTVVYIHGNRFAYVHSIEKGYRVHNVLARSLDRPAMRFIIWSWPSDPMPGPLRDARVKADRADVEGFYLACLLKDLPAETPYGFIAHSFGARVVGGAIQALATGQLNGVDLAEERVYPLPPVRIALLAAAVDGDIFLPNREFGEALQMVDQLLVLFNPHDPVLKRYALLDRFRRPRALGAVGMANVRRTDGVETLIRQRNVARAVGHSHSADRYYASPSLMAEVRQVLLGFDEPTSYVEAMR
jgi:hypothetical protein